MTFIELLQTEKGYYQITDDWTLKEQLSATEADHLWQQWYNSYGYQEEENYGKA